MVEWEEEKEWMEIQKGIVNIADNMISYKIKKLKLISTTNKVHK